MGDATPKSTTRAQKILRRTLVGGSIALGTIVPLACSGLDTLGNTIILRAWPPVAPSKVDRLRGQGCSNSLNH